MSPRGHLTTSGNTFVCHREGEGEVDIYCIKARNAAKHPIIHSSALTTENDAAQNVTSAEMRNSDLQRDTRDSAE